MMSIRELVQIANVKFVGAMNAATDHSIDWNEVFWVLVIVIAVLWFFGKLFSHYERMRDVKGKRGQ